MEYKSANGKFVPYFLYYFAYTTLYHKHKPYRRALKYPDCIPYKCFKIPWLYPLQRFLNTLISSLTKG